MIGAAHARWAIVTATLGIALAGGLLLVPSTATAVGGLDTEPVSPRPVGGVVAWGYPGFTVPAEAKHDVVAVDAGPSHALAITDTGRVLAWGSNASGQTTVPEAADTDVPPPSQRAEATHLR